MTEEQTDKSEQQSDKKSDEQQKSEPGDGITIKLPSGVIVGDQKDRPGGPSLADQVSELRDQIKTLTDEKAAAIETRQAGKGQASEAQTQIDQLTQTVNELVGQLNTRQVADVAKAAGAIDPAVVAALVNGVDNPEAAIEAMKTSHPFLFGKRPAGSDMTGGGGLDTGDGPKTDLGKFLTDNYMG